MYDLFSEVLAVLGTRSVRGTALEASGDWALSFDGRARLKFVAVVRGGCWLMLPDHVPEPLAEGDVVLLSNAHYTVASDPNLEPADGMDLYSLPGQDTVRLGGGCDTVLIGGGSGFAEGCASFVLDALPRFLRIDRLSPGAEAVARTLTSLQDEVHTEVARRWTVPILAREIGISRSALTLRFSQRVGRPPLDYLTQWRMLLAQRKLARGQAVSEVAAEVGYTSQSAFAHAFKRTMGRTPRSDRR